MSLRSIVDDAASKSFDSQLPRRTSMRTASRLSFQHGDSEGSMVSKGGLQRRNSFQAIQFQSGTRNSNTILASGDMAGTSPTDRRASQQPMSLSASAAAALAAASGGVGGKGGSASEAASFNPMGYPVASSRFYTGFRYRLPSRTTLATTKPNNRRTAGSTNDSGSVTSGGEERRLFKSKIRRHWRIGINVAMIRNTALRYRNEDDDANRLALERSQTLAAAAALAKPMVARKTTLNSADKNRSSITNQRNGSDGDLPGSSPKKNFSEAVRSALFRSRVMNYDEQVEAASKLERDAQQRVDHERQEMEVCATMQPTPADSTNHSIILSSLFARDAPLSRLVDMAPSLSERAAAGFTPAVVSEVNASAHLPGGGCEGLSLQKAVEGAVADAMRSIMENSLNKDLGASSSLRAPGGPKRLPSPGRRGYGTPGKVAADAATLAASLKAGRDHPPRADKTPAPEQPYIEKLKDTLFPALSLALEALLYQAVKQQIAREVETGQAMRLPIPPHVQEKVVEADARRVEEERKRRLDKSPEPSFVTPDVALNEEEEKRKLSISSQGAVEAAASADDNRFRPISAFSGAFGGDGDSNEVSLIEPKATTPRRGNTRPKVAALNAAAISVGSRVRKTAGGNAQKSAAVGKTSSKEDVLDATDNGGGSHTHSRSSSPGGVPGSTTANTDTSLRQRSFSTRSKSFISVQYVTSQKMGVASPLNLLAQEPASVIRKSSMRRNSSSAFAADLASPRNPRNAQKEALARAAESFFASRKTFPSSPIVTMLSASDLADAGSSVSNQRPVTTAGPMSFTPLASPTSQSGSGHGGYPNNRQLPSSSVRTTFVHQEGSNNKDRMTGHLLQDGHVFKLNSVEVVSFIGGELRKFSEKQ